MKMQDIVSQYRAILVADESLASLEDSIALARRVASGKRGRAGDRWVRLIEVTNSVPQNGVRAKSSLAQRVEAVLWALTELPTRAKAHANLPESQLSLLMDAALLVFHQAYFALLPKAGPRRLQLLEAFAAFAQTLPSHADRFHVEGLIQLESGKFSAAIEAFRAALASTHSDQHDFLTRVQTVWGLLMEQQRYNDAFQCLLDVEARVARRDLGEFQQLLRTTFAESQSPGKAHRRVSSKKSA
jgi:tetratricopeptide (TPR) repeat protein